MGYRRKVNPAEVRPMEVVFITVRIGKQHFRFTLAELKKLYSEIGMLVKFVPRKIKTEEQKNG